MPRPLLALALLLALSGCGGSTDDSIGSTTAQAGGNSGAGGSGSGQSAGGAGTSSSTAGGTAGQPGGGSSGSGGHPAAGAAGAGALGGAAGAGGAGSAGSAGIAGGSGSAGTGAGGAAGACPPSLPTGGSACSPDGLNCGYPDGCCGTVAICKSGAWTIETPLGCPLFPCPSSPPPDGSSCCAHPPSCTWDQCSPEGIVSATCDPDTTQWHVTAIPCDPVGPMCNGNMCSSGEICVEKQGGAGLFFSCTPNPCAGAPLSCACAAQLCGGPPMGCLVDDPQHLTCTCDMCP
jgi:hypothetical protein